jgi:hypothetical protein
MTLPNVQAAWERFHEAIVAAEDALAKVCVYPASLPIFELRGEVRRSELGHKLPMATLHFDGEHLRFSETRRPYPKSPATQCPKCRSECPTCRKREAKAQERWDALQTERAQVRDVLEIEDTSVIPAIVGALPAMRARLVSDAKVSPESILEAVKEANKFLELL